MDRKPVKAKSYANIAIIKYWGKEDAKQMVPSTSSISLTLENMYTETSLSPYQQMRLRMNFTSMGNSKIQLSKPKLEL